jgi:hypothetical protein
VSTAQTRARARHESSQRRSSQLGDERIGRQGELTTCAGGVGPGAAAAAAVAGGGGDAAMVGGGFW